MLFQSITFLYYFLPITLFLHWIVPEKWKNAVLMTASFFFYFWGEPQGFWVMIVMLLLGYTGGRMAARCGKWAVLPFLASVIILFLWFRYGKAAIPLGISFYTFQIISYLVDVKRKTVDAETNLLHFSTYLTMFPQLVAGPIVRYGELAAEVKKRHNDTKLMAEGACRFTAGLLKKVVVADSLASFILELEKLTNLGIAGNWAMAVAFTLQLYYDFSGYSDMAIGLGKMFGFHFPENFAYPLTAGSITEFWRRWHMTLTAWLRDYIYIPLGGNRVGVFRFIGNVLLVWLLSGLWHGPTENFAVWGLYFGVFLILEKGIRKKLSHEKVGGIVARMVGHVYTLVAVTLSFVLFRQENLSLAWMQIKAMFGKTANIHASSMFFYELKNYGILLILAAIGAAPWINCAWKWLTQKAEERNGKVLLQTGVTIAGLLLATAFIIGSSTRPFLYFRF